MLLGLIVWENDCQKVNTICLIFSTTWKKGFFKNDFETLFFCNLIISSCYPRLSSWGNGGVENNNSSRRCFVFTIVFATTLKSERNEEGQLKNRFSELACSSFKRRQRQQGERTRRSGCLCSITRSNFLRKFWKRKKNKWLQTHRPVWHVPANSIFSYDRGWIKTDLL